jgi:hypothetical protein
LTDSSSPLRLWAVGIVRNEADLLALNVRYHLDQGVSQFLFLDNGSTDGTVEILEQLASWAPVEWRSHSGPFHQQELVTQLALEAYARGAQWILPLDADEFWHAPGATVASVLERSGEGALRAQVVNFIQHRDEGETGARALLSMTRRVARPVGDPETIESLVESQAIGYIEHRYMPKWLVRATPEMTIAWGNHYVRGVREPALDTDEVVVLHAPLRSRSSLVQKVDGDRPPGDLDEYLVRAWHIRRWRRIAAEERMEAEWRANSYQDGALDVFGEPHPVVEDRCLADAVRPYLPGISPANREGAAGNREPAGPQISRDDERQHWRELLAATRAAAENELRAEGARAADFHEQLVARMSDVDRLAQEVERLATEIESAESRTRESESRTHEAEREALDWRSQFEAAQKQTLQAAANEQRLKEEYEAELERRARDIVELRASWSWSLTRPLRSFADLLARGHGPAPVKTLEPPRPRYASPPTERAFAPEESPQSAEHAPTESSPEKMGPAAVLESPGARTFLVLTDSIPTPDQDAGSLRLVELLKLLQAQGFKLMLGALRSLDGPHYAASLEALGIPVMLGEAVIESWLRRYGSKVETVVLNRPEVAIRWLFTVRAMASSACVIFDTVDLHWLRIEREAAVTGDSQLANDAARLYREEFFAARSCDRVWVVSETERARLLSEDPQLQVDVIPTIHPRRDATLPGFADRHGLLFIGGFWHRPNVDAVVFFVNEVLPLIHRSLPEVILTVVGSRMPAEVSKLACDSVQCPGYLPDVAPPLRQARVYVAPLRFGAGLKGKIGEAMSWRVPVVTTPVGAEGFEITPGREMLVADSSELFAASVVELYTQPGRWKSVADAAVRHVELQFGTAAVAARLAKALRPPGKRT